MSQVAHAITSPLTADQTTRVAPVLQQTLVELIDLSLQAKQAHWNVVGPNFRSLHEQLDEMVAEYRTWTDTVAERLVAIGVPPQGQAGTVTAQTSLKPLPEGPIPDREVVSLFVDRVTAAAAAIRERMDQLGDVDLVSQDLLIEIVHGLEKQRWMLQAQLA